MRYPSLKDVYARADGSFLDPLRLGIYPTHVKKQGRRRVDDVEQRILRGDDIDIMERIDDDKDYYV